MEDEERDCRLGSEGLEVGDVEPTPGTKTYAMTKSCPEEEPEASQRPTGVTTRYRKDRG